MHKAIYLSLLEAAPQQSQRALDFRVRNLFNSGHMLLEPAKRATCKLRMGSAQFARRLTERTRRH